MRNRVKAIVIGSTVTLVVAGFAWHSIGRTRVDPAAGDKADGPVPVTVAEITTATVPLYLDGIGTVQPYNAVTIRSRVDGQIQKIAFREGQDVRKGDLLVEIDSRALAAGLRQAEANLRRDQAQLQSARADLARTTTLSARQFASRQTLDQQTAQVGQYEAAVAADQALIESARVQLDYCTITAPIDGRAGLRLLDVGNIVHAADQAGLLVLNQIAPIAVIFTLPAQNLATIRQALQPGGAVVDAFDREGGAILASGTLDVIDNQIDQTTATIKLKAAFANADRTLWPGQFVNARLHVGTLTDALVAPAEIIQRGPQGPFAYVVVDRRAVMRPLTVGPVVDGKVVITAGLKRGDVVVVEGQYRLQDGKEVTLPAAAPAGS